MKNAVKNLENWDGGSITELAEAAAKILDELGKREDTLASGNTLSKRIRVIRDYSQRGILSDAERRGKELFYERRHLSQLVAARLLADQGVPLAAIASQFQQDPDVVVMTLGMTPAEDNAALARWKEMQERDRVFGTAAEAPAMAFADAQTTFMRSASASRGRGIELRQLLDELGVGKQYPEVTAAICIDVTQWCSVIVNQEELRELTRSEVETLGRAITGSLLKARFSRGG